MNRSGFLALQLLHKESSLPVGFFSSSNMTVSFQNSVDAAKPLLRKAIQISQQTPYWHCRLLFQLAVSTVGRCRVGP